MRDEGEHGKIVRLSLRNFLLCGAIFALAAGLAWTQGAYTMQPPPSQQPPLAPPMFQRTCSLCHGSDGRGTDRAHHGELAASPERLR